ncbi:MAG: excinuclease ABC subunit UvrC, partial [Candidatus Gracilibacteria bacterium]|nr:excinuclease ABC subunit UvrC [Candidatus Gracilibacteria bacterium]
MSNINILLKQIPKSPGIYKFFDKKGQILYIGKSVNLKSRVNSYFNGKSKLNFAKQKMVNLIMDIQTIVTNNETESLILETTLIKKYMPKYNILMKDGKNHLYIKITDDEYPMVIKTRFKNGKGTYFGPYISTFYVSNILKIIKSIFGYGIGEHNFFKTKNSYTLDKYIFKNNYKLEEYNDIIDNVKDFLNGNTTKIKLLLEEKMKEKAKNLLFEEAQKYKEKLDSIKILEENQIVRDGVTGDYNIINFIEKFEKTYIGIIEIRDSKITGFYNYDVENKLEEDLNELLIYVVENKWSEEEKKDRIVYLLPKNLEGINSHIKVEVPQIGTKKELLELCYRNIYEYAYKSHMDSLSTKGFTKQTMKNLLEILGYKQINKDIIFECNDISHISGNHTVASRSIIENGKSNTSKYKKLKIKSLSPGKIDDFNSMREVMTRRLKELEKLGNIPDLIIIDGGKGQLSSVMEIINNPTLPSLLEDKANKDFTELLKNLQVVGIAKREEELFLPGESNPIMLKKDSLELRLIQKIRDEAHRFAITFNRDSRIKAMKKNILEELPGFGPKTRKKL